MSAYLLNKLHRAAVEAVEHVASANYPEREREALRAMAAAFTAASEGRAKDIVFRITEEAVACPSQTS